MTAMCDVSFLLLTFFMLTSKFRPPEAVPIDLPNSRSQIKLENIMTISVDREGHAYFGLNETASRAELLDKMLSKHTDIQLTNNQKTAFRGLDMFGFSLAEMPGVLALNPEQYKNYKSNGIPMDSSRNELYEWILMARYVDPYMKVAIKGDKNSDITAIKDVIATLTERAGVMRFNLITTLSGNSQQQTSEATEPEN
jgi:biopolymer transport protein ExbD